MFIDGFEHNFINGEDMPTKTAITPEDLKDAAARFILKCREEHRMPLSVMQLILVDIQSLFELSLFSLNATISSNLEELGLSSEASDILSPLMENSQYTHPFLGLETPHKQSQYFKEVYNLVV